VMITTGCAPNFMGSRPADDGTAAASVTAKDRPDINARYGAVDAATNAITLYVADDNHPYRDDMVLLVTSWLEEQEKAGVNTVLMPFIGGGVYLGQVTNKDEAKAEIHKAIKIAVKNFLEKKDLEHVQRVMVSYYDDEHTDEYGPLVFNSKNELIPKQSYKDDANKGNAETGDLFHMLNHAKSRPNDFGKLGIINAGSDRSIGGNCKLTPSTNQNGLPLTDGVDPKKIGTLPFEEQLARRSTLLQQQSIELNRVNIEKAIAAAGATVVPPTPPVQANVPTGKSDRPRHQNIDALLDVYRFYTPQNRRSFVERAFKGGIIPVLEKDGSDKGNYYHAEAVNPPITINSDDDATRWLLGKIKEGYTAYQQEKTTNVNSYKLSVYNLIIPKLETVIMPGKATGEVAVSEPAVAQALTWLSSRAKAKRIVTAMELVKDHKVELENLPIGIQNTLTAAKDKQLVVMTSVPDYVVDDKKPKETTQLVKVYNGANTKPVFNNNQELADALKKHNIELTISGVKCTITGKVEQGMVAFYRTPGNPAKGQPTMISQDDITQFGANISEAVMKQLKTKMEAGGQVVVIIDNTPPAPRPQRLGS